MHNNMGKGKTKTYLDLILIKVETLLNQRGQLANSAALLTENRLSARSEDDDSGLWGESVHLQARVAILGQLTTQKLVQLSAENALADKL